MTQFSSLTAQVALNNSPCYHLQQFLDENPAYMVAQTAKNAPAGQGPGIDPWVGKIPWRREWQLTPVFLPGEFHGQRNLVGYSTLGHKKSDTTERLTLSLNFTYY